MEFFSYLWSELILVWKLFVAPFTNHDALWAILPLLAILILVNLYFGRNRSEQLGWNSAFGNSVSLLWVCVILWKYLLERNSFFDLFYIPAFENLLLVFILSFFVFILLFLNFFHKMPKKLAYFFSSADFIYVLGYVVISIVMGGLQVSKHVLLAGFILFVIMSSVFYLIKSIVPVSKSAHQVLERREEREKKEKAIKKAKRTRKKNELKRKLIGE